MKNEYIYPQEDWDHAKCERAAKRREKDGYGTIHPWKGKISDHGSPYPTYGNSIRYNGGTTIDGEWYERVTRPLPKVAKGFKIVNRPTWGYYIEKE